MTGEELSEAMPPAYAEFIARQFLRRERPPHAMIDDDDPPPQPRPPDTSTPEGGFRAVTSAITPAYGASISIMPADDDYPSGEEAISGSLTN